MKPRRLKAIKALKADKFKLEALVRQLELEGMVLQEKAAKLTEAAVEDEPASGPGGVQVPGSASKGKGAGPLLQTILDDKKLPTSPMPPFTPGQKASERTGADGDVTAILIAQRDRLQERVAVVENVRDGLKKELGEQVNLNESLRAQNQSLYERVRFAESLRGGGSAGEIKDIESLEAGFNKAHDPFADFKRKERMKRVEKLGPVEKVVYMVVRLASGHREARMGLFGYFMLLHFLIFITTWHWAHELSCDGDLHPDLLDHSHAIAMHGGIPHIEDEHLPPGGG